MWSSRENIRAQLLSLLHTTPRQETALRGRVLWLLGTFGSPEQLPLLRTVLLDAREHFSIRNVALAVGRRHGLRLSGPEVSQLLEQHAKLHCYGNTHCWGPCGPSPGEVLELVRAEDVEACTAAETALVRMSPEERTCILAQADCDALPSRLVEWLFSRWHAEARQRVQGRRESPHDDDLLVALTHRGRPEAWELLVEWTRDLSPGDLRRFPYWELSWEERERLLSAAPGPLDLAARDLLLSLPALVAHQGQEALLRRLHRLVRAQSVACRVSCGLVERPPGFARAVELLGEWREARPLMYQLLCDFDVEPEVRRTLADCLFGQDRAAAIRWAIIAARYPDNAPPVRRILRHAANAPEPGDRPLFLSGLRGEDDLSHCFALEGLFILGESGAGWCDRLTSLAQSPHPMVRLRAAACLVKEGRREWLPLLRTMAREAPESELQADAVRWLGELDAEASRPVLRQVLTSYAHPSRCEERYAQHEAAWALSRLGTSEDLSDLLNASLNGFSTPLNELEFERHLARQEGRPCVDVTTPSWRKEMSEALEEPLRAGRGT